MDYVRRNWNAISRWDWQTALRQRWDLAGSQFYWFGLAACFAGFFLIVAAYAIGIGNVPLIGKIRSFSDQSILDVFAGTGAAPGFIKEVGYFTAINWSIYGAILMPIIVGLCLFVRNSMRSTLKELAENKVIRTLKFEIVTSQEALQRWDRQQGGLMVFTVLVCTLVFGFVFSDWWQTVGGPLLGMSDRVGRPITDAVMEYDWSVAALFPNLNVNRTEDFLFGLIGYLIIPGAVSALAFATFFSAIHFLVSITGLVNQPGQPEWRLAAVPQEGDRLCGFSAFSSFFTGLVAAALAIIFGLLLMMLQNEYLRDTKTGNIGAFLIGEGQDGWEHAQSGGLKGLNTWLLQPGEKLFTSTGSEIVLPVYAFVFVVCVVASWIVLRIVAHSARRWSQKNVPALAVEQGRAEGEIKKDLKFMRFWPLAWISLTNLLLILTFLFASIFSYRLIVLAATWALISVVPAMLDLILSRFRGAEE